LHVPELTPADRDEDEDEVETTKWAAVAAYDRIAHEYEALADRGFVPHRPIFQWLDRFLGLDMCHAYVAGLDVCCGTGRYTRHMALSGLQSVVGIDISAVSLEIARQKEREQPLGIQYLLDDVCSPRRLKLGQFDVASCSLGLCDVRNLAAALHTIVALLAPGGRFAFAIPHPGAPSADGQGGVAWPKTPYLQRRLERSPNPESIRHCVATWRRPLMDYCNMPKAAGLQFVEAIELPPPEEHAAKAHELARFPYLFVACFTKPL
jgi:SAM-dependent methyltransferase